VPFIKIGKMDLIGLPEDLKIKLVIFKKPAIINMIKDYYILFF
jgi:hypothetical protein